jgi:hypothetical protein
VIEVHEGVGRPQSILELFARYHVAGTLQKYPKDLELVSPEASPSGRSCATHRHGGQRRRPRSVWFGVHQKSY